MEKEVKIVRHQFEAKRENDVHLTNINIQEKIDKYLFKLFRDVDKLINCKRTYFDENKLELETNIDYKTLFILLQSLCTRFRTIDLGFRTDLIENLRREILFLKDIESLYKKTYIGKELEKKQTIKFLKFLEKNVLFIKNNFKNEDYKLMVANKFKLSLIKKTSKHIKELDYIILLECYYLDKLIWSSANKSTKIKSSFTTLKKNKKLCLKFYLEHYLKTVNVYTMKAPLLKEFVENTYRKL